MGYNIVVTFTTHTRVIDRGLLMSKKCLRAYLEPLFITAWHTLPATKMRQPNNAIAYKKPTTRTARMSAKQRCERLRKRTASRDATTRTEIVVPETLLHTVLAVKEMVQSIATSLGDLKERLPVSSTHSHGTVNKPTPPGAPLRGQAPTVDRLATSARVPSPLRPMETLHDIARQAARELEARAPTNPGFEDTAMQTGVACQRVSRNSRGITQWPTPYPNRATAATTATSRPRTKITARKSVAFINNNNGSHSTTKLKNKQFNPVSSFGGTVNVPTPTTFGN